MSFGIDPQYESYYENENAVAGNSVQLWCAVLPGYCFNFHISKVTLFLIGKIELDYLIMKIDNNEPQEFKDIDQKSQSRFIVVPDIYLGIRF